VIVGWPPGAWCGTIGSLAYACLREYVKLKLNGIVKYPIVRKPRTVTVPAGGRLEAGSGAVAHAMPRARATKINLVCGASWLPALSADA
jgi:hypothetical protein